MIEEFYRELSEQLAATENKKDLGYGQGFYDGLLWAKERFEEMAWEAGVELEAE